MENAIATLNNTVSAAALWDVFGTAVPYIATVVIVGFGFFLVRRMISGLGRGKSKI